MCRALRADWLLLRARCSARLVLYASLLLLAPPARRCQLSALAQLTSGECKTFMLSYMKCLKANKNNSGACRPEARDYLGCRMDNELMGRDEWSNLGLGDVPATAAKSSEPAPAAAATATASSGSAGGSSSGGGGRYVPSERI